ncbi:MAG: class I SAM-dependent methyltransferase [Eubacterium sp.]|nr:class I SAM-dependent methyltransferase [Eubacterium sp.]
MENIIKDFYKHYDEDKRLTSKSHLPEYLTTMRYIKKYLKPDSKILEIGAGTGRYSLALADLGYSVDAVELVPHNIKIMKSKVKASHNINIYEGNACDLSFLENNTYDIVLLLGPMYHLFTEEDKHKAISEAIRVAKHGAVIFSAYCNNDTSMLKLFERHTFIEYKSKGHIDDNFHAKSVPELIFELYRKEDVDRIMSSFKVARLHYVGADMLSYFFKDSLNEMSDEEFELYMKYHYSVCERADFSGLSFHMLDIFRKE